MAHVAHVGPEREGFIVKDGMVGRTKTFWIEDGIRMDHSGQYAAFGAIEYQGP